MFARAKSGMHFSDEEYRHHQCPNCSERDAPKRPAPAPCRKPPPAPPSSSVVLVSTRPSACRTVRVLRVTRLPFRITVDVDTLSLRPLPPLPQKEDDELITKLEPLPEAPIMSCRPPNMELPNPIPPNMASNGDVW